jgi:hypothetical protein
MLCNNNHAVLHAGYLSCAACHNRRIEHTPCPGGRRVFLQPGLPDMSSPWLGCSTTVFTAALLPYSRWQPGVRRSHTRTVPSSPPVPAAAASSSSSSSSSGSSSRVDGLQQQQQEQPPVAQQTSGKRAGQHPGSSSTGRCRCFAVAAAATVS